MGKKDTDNKESEKKDVSGGGGGGVTVVLKVDLHCEGCAQKVKRTIKHLDGVESVSTDFAAQKITVIGKVDPAKVKEKVEKRIKKKVDLVSPQPPFKKDKEIAGGKTSDEKPEKKPSPADDNKKAEQKMPKEAAVTTVVLKTKVHCDGCAHKINKIINKCEGVKEVNVDLAKDQVTVKGTMNMTQILPYLNTKLKRLVEIAPPLPSKKEESGNKKPKDGSGSGDKKGKGVANNGEKKNKKKSDEMTSKGGEGGSKAAQSEENVSKIEVVNKMEYFGYPNGYGAHSYTPQQPQGNGYVAEYWNGPDYTNAPPDYMNAPPQYPQYLHAPQMFSDENPNACFIM